MQGFMRGDPFQVSFHKYGDNFFPGTGADGDVGYAKGAGYSVNVPLKEGMDDESYKFIYEPVMKKVMEVRVPGTSRYRRVCWFLVLVGDIPRKVQGSMIASRRCADISARGDRGLRRGG
jgi:hypothetical protein